MNRFCSPPTFEWPQEAHVAIVGKTGQVFFFILNASFWTHKPDASIRVEDGIRIIGPLLVQCLPCFSLKTKHIFSPAWPSQNQEAYISMYIYIYVHLDKYVKSFFWPPPQPPIESCPSWQTYLLPGLRRTSWNSQRPQEHWLGKSLAHPPLGAMVQCIMNQPCSNTMRIWNNLVPVMALLLGEQQS